jgi:predicted molibdopterin-dependent oxidoreductase YjgC
MGTCFDCLVEIDGVARQACMLNVRAGLAIIRLPDAQVPNAET